MHLPVNCLLHISDGKSQTKRLLQPLENDYFNLADMRFHTLLTMVIDYAQMMKFYNLRNEEEGTCEKFFSLDETVVIAAILAIDLSKLMAGGVVYKSYATDPSSRLFEALYAATSKEIGQHMVSACTVISLLDRWLQLLAHSKNEIGTELRKVLESVIIGLRKDLNTLWKYFSEHLAPETLKEVFPNVFALPVESYVDKTESAFTNVEIDTSDAMPIQSSYYALIKAIEMMQTSAARLLAASLLSKKHDPAAGLLFAFLQLFQKLQNKINRFTLNYVDFYYDQVLKAQTLDLVPDHVYLVIVPAQKYHKVLIPNNTEFLAGKDQNKQDIVYASLHDTLINDAKVNLIYTLFFKRDALSFPENKLNAPMVLNDHTDNPERQFASGCWQNVVPIQTELSADDQESIQDNPLFGASREGEQNIIKQHARMGFAVASKALCLQEGLRTIKITIKFVDFADGDIPITLEQCIQRIAGVMLSIEPNEVAKEIQQQQIFLKIFKEMFIISVTTENGWLDIAEYLPSYSGMDAQQETNSLSIIFILPRNFPPVTCYHRDIHGDGYETRLPVVRFILNPRNYLYAYDFLSKLGLAWINIEVAVKGCRTLQLHNNNGQLSAATPFAPFGPLPEVGSYLIVGSPEAANKQLTDFDIEIQWSGLPPGIGGFKTHYQGYEGFENADFLVSTSVLNQGKWQPKQVKSAAINSLFQIKSGLEGGNALSEYSTLSCYSVMPYWNSLDCQKLGTELNFTPATTEGFFKFTLIAPTQAFGHRDYPSALTEALTFNAKQKHIKLFRKLPNPPYTPIISSISVNYKARSKIALGRSEANCIAATQEKVIYLHPFGWEELTQNVAQVNTLLPKYLYSGNLFVGLKMSQQGGVITLYFHLRENSLPIERFDLKTIRWHYLANNHWVALNDKQILADSTQRFMKSGIVTVDVPADITQDNTILQKGYCWLKVSADHDLEKFCSVYSIYAQAIEVGRSSRNILTGDTIRLPVGTIVRARKSIPGIQVIKQIQPSFGGRLAEQRNHLRIRMSERLKHKNRALLPADYELLILEQFPQLYKVKCFPSMDPGFVATQRFSPGHLLIVAVPYLTQDKINTQKPLINGYLINEIKDFLKKLVSSFVTIHVINPVYEVVQVRCTVKLKNALLGGIYLNRLNQAISDFLSPWKDTIGYSRHFGWTINKYDIESFIQNLDYIDQVTNLSILRIAPKSEGYFDLFDSADKQELNTDVKVIAPLYPWSIVVPIRQHFIELYDGYYLIKPEITGIGELEIGSNFIVSE
ncbi:hypothetical protein [Nitrosomonas supralitoralis]|uniref:Baseplate J-like protein n=1 Tax=Nitrosomonas supralitoralis TaxID=2116706 RepID=A0A2P7NZQ6_9PROT|nr:hypothetical protein [Nitrosomonas supralitoralis]PSJ18963.1 hypothetical protein C7H79_00585 [Nitrosomonas supralitoralis]